MVLTNQLLAVHAVPDPDSPKTVPKRRPTAVSACPGRHKKWCPVRQMNLPNRAPSQSALDRIRTYDLPLRRRTLYPLSYEGVATGAAKGNEKELSRYTPLDVKLPRCTPSGSAASGKPAAVGVWLWQ